MQWMNTEKIDALAKEIGKENIPILMDIFLGELHLYHQQLTQGVDGGNMTYLIEISHALKSSAASFGADKLCAFARQVDSNAKQGIAMNEETETAKMLEILSETAECYAQLQGVAY